MLASDVDDFEGLLNAAEVDASNDWEMSFTSDMRRKYNQYGDRMFISYKQLETLERIAHWR